MQSDTKTEMKRRLSYLLSPVARGRFWRCGGIQNISFVLTQNYQAFVITKITNY